MSIVYHSGVAILSSSASAVMVKSGHGALYGDRGFSQPEDKEITDNLEWARWGTDNALPQSFARYFENAGVLSGAVDIISRIAMGRGIIPVQSKIINGDGKEELIAVNDSEIDTWLGDNNIGEFAYATIMDAIRTGHTWTQLLSSRSQKKVNRLQRMDASICRLGKQNKAGNIDSVYMSYEWGSAGSNSLENGKVKKIKLLDRSTPVYDLLDDRGEVNNIPLEFAITSNYPLFTRKYYCLPSWYSGRRWADIAIAVPEMKAVMFNNQMTLKYFIEVEDDYWTARFKGWQGFTDKEQEEKIRETLEGLDSFLSGNQNAYKSLIVASRRVADGPNAIPFIKITPLDDKIPDGKLLPDAATANSELLFTLMLNPALLGVDMPGGMYGGGKGGSNIREAFLAQMLVRELERMFVTKPLNVVARVNGWTKKYPGLNWRFPNHYLTTLDTGKNTKPINM